jgi:beta-lactamase regulating signal transducer with metallopeptidase domain
VTPLLSAVARCEVGGAAAAAAVWTVTRLAGRHLPPRWRYNLWLLVLLRLCLPVLPAIPVHLPRWTAQPTAVRSPSQFEPAPPEAEPGRAGPVRGDTPRLFSSPSPPPALVRPLPPFDPVPALLRTWAMVAAVLLARLTVQTVRTSRLVRSYPPLADAGLLAELSAAADHLGLRPPPAVVAPAGTGPAVTGLLRPRLLLPADFAARLPPNARRLVLLHELTHIRRRDVPIGWLASAVAAVHWFNPAAWLALSQLRTERELAADATVLDVTGDRAAYGDTLVRLVEAHLAPSPAAASAMAEPVHALHRRISMIARHRQTTYTEMVAAVATSSAVLAASLVTAAAGPASRPATFSGSTGPARRPTSLPAIRPPVVKHWWYSQNDPRAALPALALALESGEPARIAACFARSMKPADREALESYASAVRRVNSAAVEAGYCEQTDEKVLEPMDEELGDVMTLERMRVDSADHVSFVSPRGTVSATLIEEQGVWKVGSVRSEANIALRTKFLNRVADDVTAKKYESAAARRDAAITG